MIKVASSPTFLLHADSATPVEGANVDLANGNWGATQEWELINTSNGFKRIVSKTNPNMVLESAGVPANGVNVRLGTYTESTRQQWLLTDVGAGVYKITARENTTQGLDCAATPANNVNVRLWSYAGGTKQKWLIELVGNGSLALSNEGSLLREELTTISDLTLTFTNNGIVYYNIPVADKMDLSLYNLNGQKIANLFNGFRASGEHQLNINSLGISTGVYILRLTSGSKIKTLKIMINQ